MKMMMDPAKKSALEGLLRESRSSRTKPPSSPADLVGAAKEEGGEDEAMQCPHCAEPCVDCPDCDKDCCPSCTECPHCGAEMSGEDDAPMMSEEVEDDDEAEM